MTHRSNIVKEPDGGKVTPVHFGDGLVVYRIEPFSCVNLNNSFLVDTTGYSVGSIQVVGPITTGEITVAVANDPANIVAHPDVAATLSDPGTVTGFPLEHRCIGAYVSTAQATTSVELYLTLKA